MREFGSSVPEEVAVKVWDSTAELRYFVLPERPPGTEGMSEEELVKLVTRDHMVGVKR
jgi:nitrile hydratase